jgi:ADP-ribosylglycohydrolase
VPPRKDFRSRLEGPSRGWLLDQRELYSQRAPGHTCIQALVHMDGDGLEARNPSKGCGAVMRVAPVAMYMLPLTCSDEYKYAETFRLAMALAGITHGHPTAKHASGVLAVLLLGLLQGEALASALHRALELLRHLVTPAQAGAYPPDETEAALDRARDLVARGVPPAEAIPTLGEGWVSEEALAIAVYSSLTAPDFESGVRTAVNIDVDSDSTGSITGQILGAMHGDAAIAKRWLRELELREVVGAMAEDFIRMMEPPTRPLEDEERYWPSGIRL